MGVCEYDFSFQISNFDMNLHQSSLQKAQHTRKKDLVVVKLPVKAELPQKVIKADKAVQVINAKWPMKAARCQSNADCQNVVLKTRTVYHMLFSICHRLNNLLRNMILKRFLRPIFTPADLFRRTDLVKILGNGELKTKLNFKVSAVSKKARQAIEGAAELEIMELKKSVMGAKS